ncbi:nucleoside diphosphate kinase 7 isoform X2 [Sitodiplosis mosellana]|uniref:nucleoside diphosphate kinase 7 isoform X2 n=1 Tax=Sitodiplosis mosellana TaxID=263140 RepID=UPI002443945B|nr:nucleoside diphosphate kinase 7 isoform X2 [Sitodiplosis mosellana]
MMGQSFVYERLCFTVEWFQVEAGLARLFILNYFPYDKTVEMFDRQKNKIFLKRVCVPDIDERNLYIGAKLNVFGRQVVITKYEDEYTRKKLTSQRQKAFGLIPTKYMLKLSEIFKILCDNEFSIINCAMFELSRQQSNELTDILGFGINDIWCSGPSIAFVVTGCNAFHRLKQLVAGPERLISDESAADLRYGSGAMTDAVFYPNNSDDISKVCDFFFSTSSGVIKSNLCKSFENSTLCLIKPHAVLEGKCGDILLHIKNCGFVIKAMKMFNLCRQNCEEFYEVYNGVSPDYLQMVTELSSGPFIALEIGCSNSNESPYQPFRQLCGPFDPEIAREIRPKTLRAMFGVSPIKNAVHCTDLEEDCLLEVEYFFKILSQ